MSKKARAHMRITGLVQGVCYRAYTQRKGQELGLVGWVRNRADRSVELIAEGPREALDLLEVWCHQGPPSARVDQVEVSRSEATGEFTDFGVRW